MGSSPNINRERKKTTEPTDPAENILNFLTDMCKVTSSRNYGSFNSICTNTEKTRKYINLYLPKFSKKFLNTNNLEYF